MSRQSVRQRKPVNRFQDYEDLPYYRNSNGKRTYYEVNSDSDSSTYEKHCNSNESPKKKQIPIQTLRIFFPSVKSFFEMLKEDLINFNLKIQLWQNKYVVIWLQGFKIYIEPKNPLNLYYLSLLDSTNKYIELRGIGFPDSIKTYGDYDKLVNEIERIINLDYNIKCYEQESKLEKILSELKISKLTLDKTRELYATIETSIGDANLVLSYPTNIVGNRGIKYTDPENPHVILADLENVETFTDNKIKLSRYEYFDSTSKLVDYIYEISKI